LARRGYLFEREHHLRIATVLQSLNADLLERIGCLFAGGTAIALSQGEFRESIDIDFLISNLSGYRELRQSLIGQNNLSPIERRGSQLNLSREIRTDQYGIRTMLDLGGVDIKFEIVFEARIILQAPALDNYICGVATLTQLDMATSKLLANSDRWSDDAIFSRDLIDLAMLEPKSELFNDAVAKAQLAYGDSVKKDLVKAIENLKKRPGRLNACMSTLKMDSIPEAVLWEKIRNLAKF
jgi:hypothetical protein